jgi:hypothetical protein
MKAEGKLALLTVILCALIVWSGAAGLLSPDLYENETANWRIQTIGQDCINLCLIVPLLLNTSLMMTRGAQDAKLLWAGGIAYTIYTYTIYCFDVHFNNLFLVYCAILGLSIYLLIWFVYSHRKTFRYRLTGKATGAVTAIYFMLTAVLFALLWLSEILAAILTDRVPASLGEGGFFTNPVQVIDLAVCLPGLFIAGLLLLRRQKPGLILAPVLLTFMLLMHLTVGVLAILTDPNKTIGAVALTMFGLAAFSSVLLVLHLRTKTRAL